MKHYKGRYTGQVVIDFNIKPNEKSVPFEKFKDMITNELTPAIEDALREAVGDEKDGCKIEVTQQYADLYEVEDEE